jgi:hypothetical protein
LQACVTAPLQRDIAVPAGLLFVDLTVQLWPVVWRCEYAPPDVLVFEVCSYRLPLNLFCDLEVSSTCRPCSRIVAANQSTNSRQLTSSATSHHARQARRLQGTSLDVPSVLVYAGVVVSHSAPGRVSCAPAASSPAHEVSVQQAAPAGGLRPGHIRTGSAGCCRQAARRAARPEIARRSQ